MKNLLLCILFLLVPDHSYGIESVPKAEVTIDERLGRTVPAGIVMFDENGNRVELNSLLDRPAVIAPVYLGCVHACPLLLTNLAEVLGRLDDLKPGRDFRVITFSFDDRDTPAGAADKKKNYLKAVGKPLPEDAWTFLTGKEGHINKFLDSIGFRVRRDGEHGFSHPVAVVITAPGGKIVRYIEKASVLPLELTMALTEASRGRVGSPGGKEILYCFSSDPLQKSSIFGILQVTGIVMVLFVGGYLIYLLKSSGGRRL